MMRRRGFTLIELVVAMAILIVLIYMGFSAFSFVSALSRSNQNREAVLENISTVLDQMTKELRQSFTKTSSGSPFNGVDLPVYSHAADTTRGLVEILATGSPQPGFLTQGEHYFFGDYSDVPGVDKRTILRFYARGSDGVYRISYTLGLPTAGGTKQEYWVDQHYQPCEILYSREKWNDDGDEVVESGELATVISNQPVIDQVITNFTVVRPSWSDKVIQIVIEATVKDLSGNGVSKITRIAQITVRQ